MNLSRSIVYLYIIFAELFSSSSYAMKTQNWFFDHLSKASSSRDWERERAIGLTLTVVMVAKVLMI